MGKYSLYLLLLSFAYSYQSNAQDSIPQQQLKTVDIEGQSIKNQLKEEQSIKSFQLKKATLPNDLLQPLNQWLENQSNAYVKSTGINGTANLAIRGASAAQTGLFWNDLPIRNVQTGMADISVFPNFFFDDAWLLYGGKGSQLGTGTMGGALVLYNDLKAEDKHFSFDLMSKYNSLQNLDLGMKLNFSTGKSAHQIKWMNNHYRNQFSFDKKGKINKMEHAHASQMAIMTNHHWNLSEESRNYIAVNTWIGRSSQEIPATLFERDSEKILEKDFFKVQAFYQQLLKKGIWKSGLMLSKDYYEYKDWQIDLKSPYDYGHFIFQNEWLHSFYIDEKRQWHLNLHSKLPIEYSWIDLYTEAMHAGKYQLGQFFVSQDAILVQEQYNFTINAALGIDFDQQEGLNLLPSLSFRKDFKWQINPTSSYLLFVGTGGERAMRKPTLIDWYLFPGGNKNLKAEKAWAYDLFAGHEYQWENNEQQFSLKQNVAWYQRWVEDWIYWLGGTIWTPYNIAAVHNRGIESEHELTWSLNDWKWRLGATTAYNLATTSASYIMDDSDLGKQLPYTPRYQFNYDFSVTYKGYTIQTQGNYIGYRFITVDESAYLIPYYLQHLSLSKAFKIKQSSIDLQFSVFNLLNRSYEVMAYRPMPGRYFELGLKLGINK